MLGRPIDAPTTALMDRGHELESSAVDFYMLQRDGMETVAVGFCTTDDGRYGASPDRFVGEDGLLEVKCPTHGVHVGYLLHGTIAASYWPQVQGQLLVTGRKWSDVISYHPDLPMALIRVERDEEYIAKLSSALDQFCAKLAAMKQTIIDRKLMIPPSPQKADPFGLGAGDMDFPWLEQ
jgi:exodeoxyribonuclease (lambda-induced)